MEFERDHKNYNTIIHNDLNESVKSKLFDKVVEIFTENYMNNK